MEISDRHLKMIDPKGFDRIFEKERLNYETDKAAFKALNHEYHSVFGKFRYSNYKSYHSARWTRVKG